MHRLLRPAAALVPALLAAAVLASPATAADGDGPADPTYQQRLEERSLVRSPTDAPLQSDNMAHLGVEPGQVGISGCFMPTAPLFVTSGVDSVRVFDVSDADSPELVGELPNALFENEAMNCGERKRASFTQRFVLIGVDAVQASPGDPEHVNIGGGELIVVDVTDPAAPRILGRAPGSTSTHTVACVDPVDCTFAYSAGDAGSKRFSVFDLLRPGRPAEVDRSPGAPGLQSFPSPTAGHKWNFDNARVGTHTGFDGASMWDVANPRRPKLLTTTGAAGEGTDPRYPGYNDFILHNAFRPHARAFKPNRPPSLRAGNVLLVTEEDYEDVDCSTAGSFQTWWVKHLDGRPGAIVPLDKVELADLGNYPLPVGGFCSAHWFDYRPGGLVAAGFYGGGTQVLDVRNPRDIKTYAHSVWGASEVWDAMWVPVYDRGRMTTARTNVLYAIDLVRGLDVYAVDVPGDGRGALPPPSAADGGAGDRALAGALPMGLVGTAMLLALGLRLVRRRRPLPLPA